VHLSPADPLYRFYLAEQTFSTRMTQPLNDFINSVRLAESVEDEKYLIATEQAQLRAFLRKPDPLLRPRVVLKLVFLDMLGQNPAWGQMEALALMTDERLSFKRVGYVCTGILLDQTAELTILVTQTLLGDLESPSPFIQCLALHFVANLGNPEVCRAVATPVQKLFNASTPSVVKASGMATVRIIRTNPDLSDSYKNSVQTLLNHPVHGVVIAGINLVMTMIQFEPKLAKSWSQFAIPFTKIMSALTRTRPTREFSYGMFNDPYLQIKAMQALAVLRKRSDELDGILQSIVSSTESRRNTGRAILYQAVETIVAVCKKSALRGLAFNQVGRLLSMNEPNVLYSALSSFARVLSAERAIVNRGSVDSMALQRYKTQIVHCLSHPDPSIRRRALDVISALIDEANVESLIPEILSYVKLADSEFRSELVAKIYAAAQRFAPSPIWHFDTVLRILADSGDYVPMEIIASFCALIAQTAPLQQHAVQRLAEALATASGNQSLVQVAAFVIGEFAAGDGGAIASLRQIAVLPQTKAETLLYIVTAVCKLSVRIADPSPALELLGECIRSNNLEVQQRAGELTKLLTLYAGQCEEVLAPVKHSLEGDDRASIQINRDATTAKAADSAQGDDLLNLMLGTKVEPPQQGGALGDLAELAAPGRPAQPAAPQAAPLLEMNDFVIFGQTKANPAMPAQIALRLLVYGTGSMALSDFTLQFHPAPGWQLAPQPIPKGVLAPARQNPLSFVLYFVNLNNSPFALQVNASYKFGAQPFSERGTITRLPAP
jgi:hypothetical protein